MIVGSVAPKDADAAVADIRAAVDSGADVVEVRLDYLAGISESDIGRIMGVKGVKKIVALRRRKDNGFFSGTEKERFRVLSKACELGADYVDLELDSDVLGLERYSSRLIVSWHDFSKTPSVDELVSVFRECVAFGPDVVKMVTFARAYNDNVVVFEFLERARGIVESSGRDVGVCAFAMGEFGRMSRVLSAKLGGVFTYGCLPGRETALGQIDVSRLKEYVGVLL